MILSSDQKTIKTERLDCVDRSFSDADQECIYFIGSETSSSQRCKLPTNIIRVKIN